MRLFEILLMVVMAATLIAELRRGFRGYRRADAARVTGLLAVAHIALEGYRWQLLPLYLLIGALFLPAAFQKRHGLAPRYWRKGLAIGGLVVLGLTAALALLLPVPRLPQPEGPYRVGTATYHWVDRSRAETYGETPSGYRELMVQVWYPAAPHTGGAAERWLTAGVPMARAIAVYGRMPAFLLDQLALMRTHAYPEAPLAAADAPYPVVLSVHGWNGFRNINQDQLEALASRGYIVISADHTYGAMRTVFPDGRVAANNPQALRGQRGSAEFAATSQALVETYTADVRFLLDQLPQLNAVAPFADALDLERIGLFGHSTGGGAVVAVCLSDARCKAVLGMDAWIEPVDATLLAAKLKQPALFLNSESWQSGPNRAQLERFYHNLDGEAYWADIAGSVHQDFTLAAIFSPLAQPLGIRGPIAGPRVLEINRAYLIAFFEATLNGLPAPLLENLAAFPEVSFERRP